MAEAINSSISPYRTSCGAEEEDGTLAVSFYPYVIPPAVTLEEAVAPQSTLASMFWGAGIFVLQITIVYTLLVYFVFKGKVSPEQEHY
ncbi:cytochrome bd-type quinol oxidase subunit 2 [Rhizobium sp. BK181]|uniref:hypothetical protein n=1 Tax=Rhizobium sp. BK181 TaxID=2587072 RepID=UPI00161F2B90|nr:hypothetical protein [Rhizobium sp. BK181]MBB3318363.1 cytochrome bd-type quinol oxidase subunit 2 [Rhizobium sp. BK181]